MNKLVLFLSIFCFGFSFAQYNWDWTELDTMPERIANNAVCEAKVDGNRFVYSFTGIDTSKIYSGINLKTFKYDVSANEWSALADVPDTLGKMNEMVKVAHTLNKNLISYALITHAPTNPNMDDKRETANILAEMSNFRQFNVAITYRSSYWRTMGVGLSVLEYSDDKAKNELLSLGSEIFRL
jgi:hypothetical protein